MMPSTLNPFTFLHQFGFLQSSNWNISSCPQLTGKVAVITGGQAGIGAEITKQLLLHDIAQVVVLARSRERFEKARDDIWIPALEKNGIERTKADRARFVECDLGDLRVVDRVGKELVGPSPGALERLDMLFLNAATHLDPKYVLSPQGIEIMFAINHLGHYQLTQLILPLLISTPHTYGVSSTRIIVTTSSVHTICREINFESLTSPNRTISFSAAADSFYRYGRSKLASILFTRSLTKRLPENVFVNAYFPGNIPTDAIDAWKSFSEPLGFAFGSMLKLIGQTVEDGAATGIFLGVAEEVEKRDYRGKYWVPIARIEACSRVALDEGLGDKLWAWSENQVKKALEESASEVTVEDGSTGGHIHLAHPTCLTPVPIV